MAPVDAMTAVVKGEVASMKPMNQLEKLVFNGTPFAATEPCDGNRLAPLEPCLSIGYRSEERAVSCSRIRNSLFLGWRSASVGYRPRLCCRHTPMRFNRLRMLSGG
jgi:hypothetical protein